MIDAMHGKGDATVQDQSTRVLTKCPRCRTVEVTEFPLEGYQAWMTGTLIQVAMPTVSAKDREKLITGFCGPCWDSVFGEDG